MFDGCCGFSNFNHDQTRYILHRFFTIFTVVFIASTIAACQSEPPPPQLTEAEKQAEVILGDSGVFRGHHIGDMIDDVVKNDREYLFKRTFDELNYSIPFSVSDSTHFDVAYVFDQKALFEIQVDVLLSSPESVEGLFSAMRAELSERFGEPSQKQNYAFWEVKSDGRDLEITLRDVSAEYDRPFLSLNIIEPQIFVH